MRIGFIGTGTMGTPIAGCLVAAGHQLTVCDIRREATQTLQQQGAAVADTPRAVAEGKEVVFTSLPGPKEVETAALDPQSGLLAGLPEGGAYIDLTTNAPETIRRIAAACRKRRQGGTRWHYHRAGVLSWPGPAQPSPRALSNRTPR